MLTPLHVLPLFGFAALGFLMVGVILAVACWLAFRSGDSGRTKLGGFAGCMVAVALVFVAGLGALACFLVAVVSAPSELVRHGPVRKIEAHWPNPHEDKSASKSEPAKRDGADEDENAAHEGMEEHEDHGLHLRVEVAGGDEAKITRWFREHTHGDVDVSTESIRGPDGRRTRIDIRIPIPDEEIRKMRSDLERDLPNLNLPSGVTIELKGEDDD